MIKVDDGVLLIADPFLKDGNFARSVVLLTRHEENEGSFGFVLNRPLGYTLDELLNEMDNYPIPVFQGGPVQLDTIHYIHQYPDLIPDSQLITKDVYWGGNFEVLKELIFSKKVETNKIKFFLGYSGWEKGQLQHELDDNSWITATSTRGIIFETNPEKTWESSLRHLGGKYEMMINYPIDPQLN